jgi:plastocyanin
MRLYALAMIGLLAVASCGGGGDSTSPTGGIGGTGGTGGTGGSGGGGGGGGSAPVATNSVTVRNDFFDPVNASIARGTSVTWTWAPGASVHNVTFSDGASQSISSGTYSRTFPTAGTFNYTCTLHAGMNGSIIVQ